MLVEKFKVLDIQEIDISAPQKAVKSFDRTKEQKTVKCDVLIVGGGVGAVAAAMKIAVEHPKLKVCLLEETDWLGGQMTSQGVSALDENYMIETSGACRSYQNFRENIRAMYKQFHLSDLGKSQPYLNPGTSWVTYLAFEPRFAMTTLDNVLAPAISSGALQIFLRTKAVDVETDKHPAQSLRSVTAVNMENGVSTKFESKFILDATELGDLLPLAKMPYRVGSDDKSDTGEAHAPDKGDRENVQDFTYPFVVDFKPGTSNIIEKPAEYDRFKAMNKFSFEGYKMFEESVLDDGNRIVPPFWTYRRLIASENFADPQYPFDVAMINWDSNDLRGHNVIDQTPQTQAERLALGKALSLGFLYWLQTEAPRDEGGQGYPELQLRKDVLGTEDGLSKFPYIREARRLIAKKTILEKDIVAVGNPLARSRHCADTLGIGLYPVDIHGRQEVPGAGQQTKPFQIPMAALVPEQGGKILPACKNIGVTHITNGAYRLQPVEWAIGEAQAAVVAFCLEHHTTPEKALAEDRQLRKIQKSLIEGGSPLIWFDDVPTSHPQFVPIQYTTLIGLLDYDQTSLHFGPDEAVTGETALRGLSLLHNWKSSRRLQGDTTGNASDYRGSLTSAQKHGYLKGLTGQTLTLPLTVEEFDRITGGKRTSDIPEKQTGESKLAQPSAGGEQNYITRSQWARWLYDTETSRHSD